MSQAVEALIRRINADASIAAIVGSRVYAGWASEQSALPYLTVEAINTEPVTSLAPSDSVTTQTRIEINSWADSYQTLVTLTDALRASLSGWRDTNETPRIDSVLLERQHDQHERPNDGSDRPTFRTIQDFVVWFEQE